MITETILKKHHAAAVSLGKGEMLFQQGDAANFFFIVKSGKIKMSNYSDDGGEFVQSIVIQTGIETPMGSGQVAAADPQRTKELLRQHPAIVVAMEGASCCPE